MVGQHGQQPAQPLDHLRVTITLTVVMATGSHDDVADGVEQDVRHLAARSNTRRRVDGGNSEQFI